MLKLAERDDNTVFIYGTQPDVNDAQRMFRESGSLFMISSYDHYPALVIKKTIEK